VIVENRQYRLNFYKDKGEFSIYFYLFLVIYDR